MCKKIGGYICPTCFSQISFDIASKCLICEKPSLDGRTHPRCRNSYSIDGYIAGVAYKRVMKKLLYQFKYKPYLFDLQTVLGELLYENLIQNELFTTLLSPCSLVVPIPLSKTKLRKRGYNQAELLAKGLSKRFNLEVQNILTRAKETKPQYGLSREERIENMKGAFEISPHVIARSRTTKQSQQEMGLPRSARNDARIAFLVDDVLTTGSTLREAAKVLKRNGFQEVWGIVLAQD